MVPYRAELYRDALRNSVWWSYNGYIQDSYSRGRFARQRRRCATTGSTRSTTAAACRRTSIRPDLLPAQCEEATQSGINPNTGQMEEIRPFGNLLAARVGDLRSVRRRQDGAEGRRRRTTTRRARRWPTTSAACSQVTRLTFGSNANNGTCTGTSCWTDANMDGVVQAQRADRACRPRAARGSTRRPACLRRPATPSIPTRRSRGRAKPSSGMQHELIANLAVGVDYIYRKYDRGLATYTLGYQPGAPGYPLSQIYTGPLTHTDPISGNTGEYYVVQAGRDAAVGRRQHHDDRPELPGLQRRRHHRHQALQRQVAAHRRADDPGQPAVLPGGFGRLHQPDRAQVYRDGVSTLAKYVIKLNGSYDLPWGIMVAGNFNMFQGAHADADDQRAGQRLRRRQCLRRRRRRSATRRWSSRTRNGVPLRATPRCSTWACRRPSRSAVAIQAEVDGGPVQRVQHQHGPDLLEQQRQPANSTAPASIIPPRVLRFGLRASF